MRKMWIKQRNFVYYSQDLKSSYFPVKIAYLQKKKISPCKNPVSPKKNDLELIFEQFFDSIFYTGLAF